MSRPSIDGRPYEKALLQLLPPPEQALLLAACLHTGDEARDAWSAFVAAVRDPKAYFESNYTGLKGLLPFVEAQLTRNRIDAGKAFHTYARVALVREELRSRIYGEILESVLQGFSEQGISPLMLKGAAISATVYPQPSTRHNHGIDLLVAPEEWAAASVTLPRLEFQPGPIGPGAASHQDFRHSSGLALGLHSRPFFLPHFDLPLDAVRARARSIQLGARIASVMSPEDTLVHLCGHAAYSRSRANLRWACDVFLLLSASPDIDWRVVIDTAERARLALPLLVLLRWQRDVLHAPVPAEALTQLSTRSRTLDPLGAEGIQLGLLQTLQSRRQTFEALSASRRAQARLVRFAIAPSPRFMRWKHNIAGSGQLALRYADRPRRVAAALSRVLARRMGLFRSARPKLQATGPLASAAGAEFELMCLSARIAFAPDAEARVKSLLASGLDWQRFLAGVERHFVAPLVHRNLRSIRDSGIPPKVLDTLRVRSKITAFKNEMFASELARLSRLFESNSIEIVSYKGAATAQRYYGATALRNFNDLDFLVRLGELRKVVAILEAEGYRLPEPLSAKEFEHNVREFKEFLFTRGEISLEPHWSLAGKRYPFKTDYEGFWRRCQLLALGGAELRIMGDEDALLVLCLVGAKGRWKRLQMITDVAACMNACPNLDWASIEAMARATGSLRILHLGLFLAAELGGARLTESMDREVRRSASVRKLARQVTASLAVAPRPSRFLPATPQIFSPMLFRQRERYRDRLLYLWRTTTTPDRLHLRRLPLPRPFFPLYRLFVPLHDFVAHPAWQLGKRLLARN